MEEKEFKRYRYLGYWYPGVPGHWQPIVLNMLKEMDEYIKPKLVPRFIYNWASWLARRNSVVNVSSTFWYNISNYLNKGNFIFDIKDKYATLRVYGDFSDEIYKIIKKAEIQCENTCERCGGTEEVKDVAIKGWVTNLCINCRTELKPKKNDSNIGNSISK
jgi:hypothetical protein